MSWYEFRQNNSGGGFDVDEMRGLSVTVIVEADNADEANERAVEIGVYFDGIDTGDDCDCCGDRWSPAWGSGDEVPSVYGTPIAEAIHHVGSWVAPRPEAYIHPKEGPAIGLHLINGRYVRQTDQGPKEIEA